MLDFLKPKAKSKGRVGLVVNPHTIAIAYLEERDGSPYLIACERVDLNSEKDTEKELTALVKRLDLEGKECSYK